MIDSHSKVADHISAYTVSHYYYLTITIEHLSATARTIRFGFSEEIELK